MATMNLGRVKPIFTGAYSGSYPYVPLDFLKYNGVSYFCKVVAPIGTLPTNTSYFEAINDGDTAANVLVKLLTVDGTGSSLDADMLDGQHGAYYAKQADYSAHATSTINPHATTKAQVGLSLVEDKSSATIRGELTSGNVTTALGFTPAVSSHTHSGVYQLSDGDLTAIAGLTGTTGMLKKLAADSWVLDTNTYLTSTGALTPSRLVITDVSGVLTTSSITTTKVGYLSDVTSNLQAQLTSKAPVVDATFTGTIVLPLTTSIGDVTAEQLGYLKFITSDIQTQLNAKGTGTVTSISAGIGLSGGTISDHGTISLANTEVTAGSYTTANITVDAQGRVTYASNGLVAAGVTSLNGMTGALTDTGFGDIGGIAMLYHVCSPGDATPAYSTNIGWTYPGSDLVHSMPLLTGGVATPPYDYSAVVSTNTYPTYTNFPNGGTSVAGTWRCLSRTGRVRIYDESAGYSLNYWTPGLFVRIA